MPTGFANKMPHCAPDALLKAQDGEAVLFFGAIRKVFPVVAISTRCIDRKKNTHRIHTEYTPNTHQIHTKYNLHNRRFIK